MKFDINNKTKIFISISHHPGNKGTNFFNYLFKTHRLNAIYFPVKLHSLKMFKNIFHSLNLSGCSVSMPFKTQILNHIDVSDKIVKKTYCANTIIKKNEKLCAFNCDYYGIEKVFKILKIDKTYKVLILGNGAMARNTLYYLNKINTKNIFVCARKMKNNFKINKKNFFKWTEIPNIKADLIVNATPMGMPHLNKSPILKKHISNFKIIIDYTINKNSKIKYLAKASGVKYIDGDIINFYQACNQANIYLKRRLDEKTVNDLKKKFKIKI